MITTKLLFSFFNNSSYEYRLTNPGAYKFRAQLVYILFIL